MIKKMEKIVLVNQGNKKKSNLVNILTNIPMSIDDVITIGKEYGFENYHVVMDALIELKERLSRQEKNKLN